MARFCGSATSACQLVAARQADLAACFLSVADARGWARRDSDRIFNKPSLQRLAAHGPPP